MDLVLAHTDSLPNADRSTEEDPFASLPTITPVDTYWFQPTRDVTWIAPFAWDLPRMQSAS